VLPLRLTGHRVTQVALDGASLPAPTGLDRVVLAPETAPTWWCGPPPPAASSWSRTPTTAVPPRWAAPPITDRSPSRPSPWTGPARPSPALPDRLPAEPLPGGPVAAHRRVIFGGGMGMGGMGFTIDGRTFDPARDDQTVRLGSIEEWDVVNTGPLAHPFHLHTWPFTVVADSSGRSPTGTAQDVVLIPARGWARLRIAFTRHAGRGVYHCHILDHEDAGMMATVAVR